MKYLLDTNVVIAASLGRSPALRDRMAVCAEGDLVTSTVVYAEVIYGSMRGKPPPLDRLKLFFEEVPVLAFDLAAAIAYASLPFKRASYDQLIAAHALSLGLSLVTHNARQFADIPDLQVENWMVSSEPAA